MTKVRLDQDVIAIEAIDLSQCLLAQQNREHLLRDRDCRVEFVDAVQGVLDVDGDDDVDSHRLHDVNRQVLDQSAVDEQRATDADRREHGGHRHTGANRLREIALTHHKRATAFDIGGDGSDPYGVGFVRDNLLPDEPGVVDAVFKRMHPHFPFVVGISSTRRHIPALLIFGIVEAHSLESFDAGQEIGYTDDVADGALTPVIYTAGNGLNDGTTPIVEPGDLVYMCGMDATGTPTGQAFCSVTFLYFE